MFISHEDLIYNVLEIGIANTVAHRITLTKTTSEIRLTDATNAQSVTALKAATHWLSLGRRHTQIMDSLVNVWKPIRDNIGMTSSLYLKQHHSADEIKNTPLFRTQ